MKKERERARVFSEQSLSPPARRGAALFFKPLSPSSSLLIRTKSHLLLDVPGGGDVGCQVEVGQRVEADGRARLDGGADDGDLLDQARDGGGLRRGAEGEGRGQGREGEGGEGAAGAVFFFGGKGKRSGREEVGD